VSGITRPGRRATQGSRSGANRPLVGYVSNQARQFGVAADSASLATRGGTDLGIGDPAVRARAIAADAHASNYVFNFEDFDRLLRAVRTVTQDMRLIGSRINLLVNTDIGTPR